MERTEPVVKHSEVVAEFTGTFMLIFTVGCNVLLGSATWGATSIACVLMVCVWALGDVSGANFNPAVSVALGVAGKMKWPKVAVYIVTQLIAGVIAGIAYVGMCGKSFNLEPAKGYGAGEVAIAEFLYTFMLCFVVLNVAASKVHAGCNEFYGLAIGFVIIAGGYSAGHFGAGCFNPAVAFGIDVSSAFLGFGWCLWYSLFELLGAVVAALFFRICRKEEESPVDDRVVSIPGDERGLVSKGLAEFLGTYFLVLTVGLNVLGGSKAAVWSIAASLMCMIYALGTVSGAHFNPAVTVAVVCALPGKWTAQNERSTFFTYILAQLTGGILGAFTCIYLEHGDSIALKPNPAYGMFPAWIGEFVFTFVLCFIVLNVTTGHHKHLFGLAIGACVTVGGLAIGGISGGSLNPAVTFGLAISRLIMEGEHMMIVSWLTYSLFEILAGATAAGMVLTLRAEEKLP